MRASDEIYELIKSLTKEERSFFRKYAATLANEGNNNYLKLFDEIQLQVSKSEEYDEKKIKEKSFTGKFQKNFPYHKNYLYNLILSAMVLYSKDKREFYNLHFLISQAKFLFERVLYEQAYKVLLKAKKIAYEDENFAELQTILNWERTILRKIIGPNEYNEKSIQIYNEMEEALEKQKNVILFGKLYSQIGTAIEKSGTGFTRNEKDFSVFDITNNDELMKDESKATTMLSKFFFHSTKMVYYQAIQDNTNAYIHSKKIVELFDSPARILSRINWYVVSLNNFCIILIRLGKFDEYENTKNKMIDLRRKYGNLLSENEKALIFYSTSVLGMSPIFAKLTRERLSSHLEEVTKGFVPVEDKIHVQQRIIVYFFVGLGYFVLGDYEKCIYWLGKIINSVKTDLSEDYQAYARIVNLISYYELEYFDSLEYVLKSTYHYLNKRKRVYKYENIVLKYLRRSFRIKTQAELYEMFDEMNYELKEIAKDPFEKNAFDGFNILFWLESKLKKKTIIDVMTSKSD